MSGQVRHLIDMAQRPNIEIQVLPFTAGAHAGGTVPFVLLSFNGGSTAGSVVYLEARGDGFYVEQEEEIMRYRLVFSRTQGSAMSVEDTTTFLETLVV